MSDRISVSLSADISVSGGGDISVSADKEIHYWHRFWYWPIKFSISVAYPLSLPIREDGRTVFSAQSRHSFRKKSYVISVSVSV